MSKLNVTGGEWVADDDGSGYISSGDTGIAIAVFYSDALLMAQSKAMYELLDKISKTIESSPNEIGLADDIVEMSLDIEYSLKKARGETR